MRNANEILETIRKETEVLINAGPQAAPEAPVGPYITRETARHVAAGKLKTIDANDPSEDILRKVRPHFLPGEKFCGFIARIGISIPQIRSFTPADIASFVRRAEEDNKDCWQGPPVNRMPESYTKPRPQRTLIATGGLGEK